MGHNTLRRHLHLLGLHDSPLCRKCGVREETSAHILCECEALASLRHMHLGSFFLEPEDIRSLGLGAIWNFSKATGLTWFDMGHKGPAQRPRCIGAERPRTQMPIYLSIYLSIIRFVSFDIKNTYTNIPTEELIVMIDNEHEWFMKWFKEGIIN